MKLLMMGIAGLFGLSACGADVIVGDGGGGSSGAGAPNFAGNAGAFALPVGASNGGGGYTVPADCSASPESDEAYSSLEELGALLIGQWRRCQEARIPGEDIGVEFTADGKIYPLTTDDSQEVVRRTGVAYEKTWAYTAPDGEDPISHRPSRDGFMVLDGVITSAPGFTVNPRQMRILLTPAYSKYVPLLP